MDARWQRALEDFLSSIENISGSVNSRLRYAYVLRSFFDTRNPDEMSRHDVQAYLDSKSTSPRNRGAAVSPGTRNNRLMCLNSFYKYAASYGMNGEPLFTARSPTFGLRYLKIGASPHALSADELERFFAVIPKESIQGLRDRALFLTFFWTARRRSEIARLHWRDIEQAVIVEQDGTRRSGIIYRYISKGHSRETQIAELPLPAYTAIISYLERADRLQNMQPASALFTSSRPSQRHRALTGDRCNALFKYYCKQAGLSPRYSLHSLRHARARISYESGASIRDIQQLLGHASISTTALYLRTITGIADPTVRLLEKRFGDL